MALPYVPLTEPGMLDLHTQLADSTQYLRRIRSGKPAVGIVLGSGLGLLSECLERPVAVEGADIPGYPRATAMGHRGRLLFGDLAGVPVVLMDGRLHRYEGHGFDSIVYPVRLMIRLGIDLLVVSNAAGGINPEYSAGDLVVLDDHINLMWGNPLRGLPDQRPVPRFSGMREPYDAEASGRAFAAAQAERLHVHRGVYLALTGPNYETPAEYRMARRLGADVVGMSTVPEVIAARHAGVRVLGLSVVSNVAPSGEERVEDASGLPSPPVSSSAASSSATSSSATSSSATSSSAPVSAPIPVPGHSSPPSRLSFPESSGSSRTVPPTEEAYDPEETTGETVLKTVAQTAPAVGRVVERVVRGEASARSSENSSVWLDSGTSEVSH